VELPWPQRLPRNHARGHSTHAQKTRRQPCRGGPAGHAGRPHLRRAEQGVRQRLARRHPHRVGPGADRAVARQALAPQPRQLPRPAGGIVHGPVRVTGGARAMRRGGRGAAGVQRRARHGRAVVRVGRGQLLDEACTGGAAGDGSRHGTEAARQPLFRRTCTCTSLLVSGTRSNKRSKSVGAFAKERSTLVPVQSAHT